MGQAGRFTFNEAFIANNIALVHELEMRFPKHARVNIDKFDLETDSSLLQRLAQKLNDKDELGLLWDRDTVAFYGDPAWSAKLSPTRALAWQQTLTERDGVFTLELTGETEGGLGGTPAIQFLPRRVRNVHILEAPTSSRCSARTSSSSPPPITSRRARRCGWSSKASSGEMIPARQASGSSVSDHSVVITLAHLAGDELVRLGIADELRHDRIPL